MAAGAVSPAALHPGLSRPVNGLRQADLPPGHRAGEGAYALRSERVFPRLCGARDPEQPDAQPGRGPGLDFGATMIAWGLVSTAGRWPRRLERPPVLLCAPLSPRRCGGGLFPGDDLAPRIGSSGQGTHAGNRLASSTSAPLADLRETACGLLLEMNLAAAGTFAGLAVDVSSRGVLAVLGASPLLLLTNGPGRPMDARRPARGAPGRTGLRGPRQGPERGEIIACRLGCCPGLVTPASSTD